MDIDKTKTINDLDAQTLLLIFRELDSNALIKCLCVSTYWKEVLVTDDDIWVGKLEDDFDLTANRQPLQLPDGNTAPTYYAAYSAWKGSFARYGTLALRAMKAWHKIEDWTAANMPQIRQSLRPGCTEEQLDQVEREVGGTLPPALRVLYRIHDGQELEFDNSFDLQRAVMGPSLFHGLFGGYSFYSHLVSTRMLPLKRLLKKSMEIYAHTGVCRFLFAASFNYNKILCCDASSGTVIVRTRDRTDFIPAIDPHVDEHGMMRWFEAYAAALIEGRFPVEAITDEIEYSHGICLFSKNPPFAEEAITHGVRVRASSLFIPEMSDVYNVLNVEADGSLDPNSGKVVGEFFHAYSIRYSLLSAEEQAVHPSCSSLISSVQLRDRHWVIKNSAGGVESEVRGEGVVGMFPSLVAGGEEYVYQSCTPQTEHIGSMEGDFTFVEGSLVARGRELSIKCPKFDLIFPDVVF